MTWLKCLTFFLIFVPTLAISKADITVVGYVKFANGLGRVTTMMLDVLSDHCKVGFIDTRPSFTDFSDIPNIIKKNISFVPNDEAPVAILTDNLWLPNLTPSNSMPNSLIKFAYSMCESTKIPSPWVKILNNSFDGVIVPDESLIKVYKDSGVTIPIFVLPIALYLDPFLSKAKTKKPHSPFAFGISAALSRNKNVEKLVISFAEEFGNNPRVALKIHSSWKGNGHEIEKIVQKYRLNNVTLHTESLSWQDYIEFMDSLDCYTLLSKGEGFSITVREALALSIPCIISNNTAHTTITKTGYVYSVPANIRRPSDKEFYNVDVGDNFDCKVSDVRKALREVYSHYSFYEKNARKGKEWVKTYLPSRLSKKYLALAKPKKVLLGSSNKITDDQTLITTSKSLYDKFKVLQKISAE